MAAQDNTGQKIEKEKVLLTWTALSRPFKKYTREFYVTLFSGGALFGLILYLIDGILPVFLLVALAFLFYVLSNTHPEELTYQITSFGIRIGDGLTPWDKLGRFWFVKRFDSDLLVVEVASIAGRLEIVVEKSKKDEVQKALEEYLVYEKTSPSGFDKVADWVGNKILQHASSKIE